MFIRLNRITFALLEINERLYDVTVDQPDDVDARISRLREQVLLDVEGKLAVQQAPEAIPLRKPPAQAVPCCCQHAPVRQQCL